MASIKKIKSHPGNTAFLEDLKRVRDILVWSSGCGDWLHVKKSEVMKAAQEKTIKYTMNRDIFVVRRWAMVIES